MIVQPTQDVQVNSHLNLIQNTKDTKMENNVDIKDSMDIDNGDE